MDGHRRVASAVPGIGHRNVGQREQDPTVELPKAAQVLFAPPSSRLRRFRLLPKPAQYRAHARRCQRRINPARVAVLAHRSLDPWLNRSSWRVTVSETNSAKGRSLHGEFTVAAHEAAGRIVDCCHGAVGHPPPPLSQVSVKAQTAPVSTPALQNPQVVNLARLTTQLPRGFVEYELGQKNTCRTLPAQGSEPVPS